MNRPEQRCQGVRYNQETLHDLPNTLTPTGIGDEPGTESPAGLFLRVLAGHLPDLLWSTDSHFRFTSSFGPGLAALNLRINQVVGMTLQSLYQTSDPEFPAIAAHRRALQGQSSTYELQWQEHCYMALVEPLRRPNGTIEGCIGMAFDITPHKRGEEVHRAWQRLTALRADVSIALAKDQALRPVLQACAQALVSRLGGAFAGIWTFHSAEQVLELQASAGPYTPCNGSQARIALGQFPIGLVGQSRQPCLTNDLLTGSPSGDPERAIPESMRAFAGYPLLVEGQLVGVMALFSRTPLPQATEEVLAAVADAIAQFIERHRLEDALRQSREQFRQAQKLEPLARLAGGLAHDFNNLLTAILCYCELLLPHLPADGLLRENLEQIQLAGQQASLLARRLLLLGQKEPLRIQVLDLNAEVAGTEKLLQRLIGEDIELVLRLDPTLAPVRADPGQIDQILLNLAVNARDAMPQGGQLTLETANIDLTPREGAAHPNVPPGAYVLLAVTDTGCGMEEGVKAHLFEPFFTTKEPGKGTGLGLATVAEIVQQAGGRVTATSEPGRGATFRVYWPRVSGGLSADKPLAGRASLPRGRETVLLVEDAEAVRALTRQILQTCGYTVLEAGDGEEALRIAQGYAGRLDLLVADLVLPRVGGKDLADRLLLLQPQIRVLFLSGYTEESAPGPGVLGGRSVFLPKPFTPLALALKVRAVLDGQ